MSQPELSPALIRAALTTVKYPGFSRDIVSFGLVKDITVSPEGAVVIELLIESKNSDVPRFIYENVMATVKELPGVKKLDGSRYSPSSMQYHIAQLGMKLPLG